MKYFTSYVDTVCTVLQNVSLVFILLFTYAGDPIALVMIYFTFFIGLAGPISLWINKKEKS